MKQMFLSTGKEFKEIETFEPGAWIHLVNPSQEEAMKVAERFNIDIQDLRAPLDVEETSRIDVEDDYTLILVDVPTQEERITKATTSLFHWVSSLPMRWLLQPVSRTSASWTTSSTTVYVTSTPL